MATGRLKSHDFITNPRNPSEIPKLIRRRVRASQRSCQPLVGLSIQRQICGVEICHRQYRNPCHRTGA